MNKEDIIKKHREYLRQHEGLRYLENATKDNINRKWLEDYKDDKYKEAINLNEIAGTELVIEYDEISRLDKNKKSNKKQRRKWIKKTLNKLGKENVGYSHYNFIGGKCSHIHLTLNHAATKEEKEFITKYYIPIEAQEFVDLSLCGVHLIATPHSKHWKYNSIKECVEEKGGLIIDVDDDLSR